MHEVTKMCLEVVHSKWKILLNTPTKTGKLLIDILDETITAVVSTGHKLCPDHPSKVLRCLRLDPDLIKVILIGQDPFPQPGVATGLAFACEGTYQPSLNILVRELRSEYDDEITVFDGNLKHWEEQGVLLLNSSLSCEQFKPGTHSKLWEEFIAGLLNVLNDFKITRESMNSLVFVFLGKQAQLFQSEIQESWHFKINRFHPAAETYGGNKFTGFYKEVNKCLIESGQTEINWL